MPGVGFIVGDTVGGEVAFSVGMEVGLSLHISHVTKHTSFAGPTPLSKSASVCWQISDLASLPTSHAQV